MLDHPFFPKNYNSLIIRSSILNKQKELYVSFSLVNRWFKIKEVTRDIEENYVSTFFILQMFWSLKVKYIIHSMLYFPILWVVTSADSYLSIKDKSDTFYVISYCICTTLQFTDMKEYEVEEIAGILCQLSTGKSLIESKIIYKGYCRHSMLATFIFYKWFSFINKEVKYIIHYMLDFTLLKAVTSTCSYQQIKNKYPTFYVGSSCLSKTFQYTDSNEYEVEEIADVLCYISTG